MSEQPAAPRLAVWLLQRAAPPRLGESVAGDLLEEWTERGRASRTWFWAQAVALATRFLWNRARAALRGLGDGRRPAARESPQGDGIVQTLSNDVRYGLRMLARSPGFTLVAVLTLALGIGANTAVFSVVSAVMLKPLPLPDSDRLVTLTGQDGEGRKTWISYPDFEDIRRGARDFEAVSAFVPQSVNLTGREEPRRVRGGFVSDDFFNVVGVEPAVGRGFRPGVDDLEGAERVCVVQHEVWQSLFGGDPSFLGKTLILNNEPFTVVGILPAGFRFPFDEVQVWIPHHDWPVYRQAVREGWVNRRSAGLVGPIARLKPGVTRGQAEAEIHALMSRLARQHPEGGPKRSAFLTPMKDVVIRDVRLPVLVLLGAVGFVLLIACANVASLLLSRAAARQRELATRAALGAGRGRLVRQLMTETGLLWLAGGGLGLVAGRWGLELLLASVPHGLPGGIQARLDASVFLFASAATLATGLVFGLIPALRYSAPNLSDSLKEGGSAGIRSRLRATLVVSQVALALVLLTGSGLMLHSFERLLHVDVGFRPDKLLTMEYRLPRNKYPTGPQQWEVHRRIIARVRQVPGVRSASLIHGLPFSGNGGSISIEIPDRPKAGQEGLRARANAVSPGAFETLGIPLLRGRALRRYDSADAPLVVVVNRTMAERFWPDRDPIGRQIRVLDDPPATATIVGVVGDIKQYGLDEQDQPSLYVSQAQQPGIFDTLVVRTQGNPLTLASAVRAAVWSVDPEQPVWKIRTVAFLIDRSLALRRFLMELMGVYAGLALLLAAVGLYGVMSYSVAQRTREIGVRTALGARRGDVLRLVLGRGLQLTGLGAAFGLGAALALGRVVRSLLYETSPADPATLAAVVLLLSVVALVAAYVPARRATRVDPVNALRYE